MINYGFWTKLRKYKKEESSSCRRGGEILGLMNTITTKPACIISGGQRQRVALVRAIVRVLKFSLWDDLYLTLDMLS